MMNLLGIIFCFLAAYFCTGLLLASLLCVMLYLAHKYYPERVQATIESIFYEKFTKEEFEKIRFKCLGIIPVTDKNLWVCCCIELAALVFLKWPKVLCFGFKRR